MALSMTSEEEMTDPRATSDNVMTIFTSFQQTFNTEQDTREVGMIFIVQYTLYFKLRMLVWLYFLYTCMLFAFIEYPYSCS